MSVEFLPLDKDIGILNQRIWIEQAFIFRKITVENVNFLPKHRELPFCILKNKRDVYPQFQRKLRHNDVSQKTLQCRIDISR